MPDLNLDAKAFQTVLGKPARLICRDLKGSRPLVFAVDMGEGRERLIKTALDGSKPGLPNSIDIVVEVPAVEAPAQEYKFAPIYDTLSQALYSCDKPSGYLRLVFEGEELVKIESLSLQQAGSVNEFQSQGDLLTEEGWIPWNGGARPVSEDTWLDYKLRRGITYYGRQARGLIWTHAEDQDPSDIIAYRLTRKKG